MTRSTKSTKSTKSTRKADLINKSGVIVRTVDVECENVISPVTGEQMIIYSYGYNVLSFLGAPKTPDPLEDLELRFHDDTDELL